MRVEACSFDVIFLDVGMGDEGGIATARTLRKLSEEVPIVFVTAILILSLILTESYKDIITLIRENPIPRCSIVIITCIGINAYVTRYLALYQVGRNHTI